MPINKREQNHENFTNADMFNATRRPAEYITNAVHLYVLAVVA